MADIIVERTPELQIGRPRGVRILLVGDKGETKGFVSIYPRFEKPPFTDTFRIEITKGGPIFPETDIRVTI